MRRCCAGREMKYDFYSVLAAMSNAQSTRQITEHLKPFGARHVQ